MQLLVEYRERTDEELAALVGTGDRDALGMLYERHVDALFAYAARIVKDSDAAADIVQTTYVKAWNALSRRDRDRPIGEVRGWLFTIARNAALDEMRKQGRIDLSDDTIAALQPPDPRRSNDPAAAAMDAETAALVWDAAGALSDDDQVLLDLYLRRGLTADELAVSLAVTKGTIYTRLSRLRDSLGDALTGTLLIRHGRSDCPELDLMLSRIPAGTPALSVRRTVVRHARSCEVCEESRRRLVSPLALLVAVPVFVPDDLRDGLWQRIDDSVDPPPAAGTSGTASAVSTAAPAAGGVSTAVIAAAVIAAVLGLAGVLFAFLDGGRSSDGAPRDPDDVHSTSHSPGATADGDRVAMAWTAQQGATGYSVSWDHEPAGLPDATADLPGDATGVRSPPLDAGQWWFHLRTRGENGEWTSTVHVGPFVIAGQGEEGDESPSTTTTVATTTSTTATTSPPTTATSAPTSTTASPPTTPPPTVLGAVITAPTTVPPVTLPPTTLPTTTTTRRPTTTTTRAPTTTTTATTVPTTSSTTTTSIDFSGVVVPPIDTETTEPPRPQMGTVLGGVSALFFVEEGEPIRVPVAGASIVLEGQRGSAVTDEGGHFVLDVPPGEALFRVIAKGFQPVLVGPIKIGDGAVVPLDIVLIPAQELTRTGAQ